jgi:hypothetical protein
MNVKAHLDELQKVSKLELPERSGGQLAATQEAKRTKITPINRMNWHSIKLSISRLKLYLFFS